MKYGLTKARVRFAGGTAVLALSASAAMAQQSGIENVVVSSTRLQAAGFDAPTPTTVVSAADLENQARPNVFDTLTQLPAMQGSQGVSAQAGTTSNGLSGISSLGLRGLSPLRTLVLVDSQRIVAANENGVADVSMLPQLLIQRVDVVTGGASASWGSDAVAGVVNFVTDKKFEGFKANFMGGATQYADAGNLTAQLAAGTSFAGGRAHFEISAEFSYNAGLTLQYPQTSQHTSLPGNIGGRTLSRLSGTATYSSDSATPAGQPRSFYGPLAQQTSFAAYGLITSGPKAGTSFGADGSPFQLALAGSCSRNAAGVITGAVGSTCFGTAAQPGDHITTNLFAQGLVNPLVRGNTYMRLSYDLSPTTEVYTTLLFAEQRIKQQPAQGNSNKSGTMRCDNAYLPSLNLFGAGLNAAETQAACLAAYPGNAISYGSQWANIPTNQEQMYKRAARRYVIGADGTFNVFGKTWNWDSYFEHGETGTSIKIYNMPLSNSPVNPATGKVDATVSRFNLAQDAVVNSAGNVVCRNTIAQTFGCTPFNPFAGGNISNSAIAYFDNQNSPGGTTNGNNAIQTNRQEAFSFSVNGSPIEDWAGPVAVAAGYEYREEHYSQRGDPYAAGVSSSTPPTLTEPCIDPFVDCGLSTNGALGAYNAGNFHNGRGTYHVNEVFLEVGIPLLNDAFWGKADLDIAGRHARYSTAGDANTWKVGVTWDTPIPGIRVRALQSRDIRAPNLSELFLPPVFANGSFINEFTGNPVPQNIVSGNTGNTKLKPEKAQTTEVGIVWQPDFIPGFQASIDYYRIGVKGAIISFAENTQLIEDLCFTGVAGYCEQNIIHTANGINQSASNPGGPATGSGQVPSQVFRIDSAVFNAGSLLTDGFDFEASYQFDMQDYDVPGSFVLRSLVNHTSKYLSDNGIPGSQRFVESVGNLSAGNNGSTYNGYGGAVLGWKILETQSYQNDQWGFVLTERWLSGGLTTNKNTLVCAPGTCPAPTVQTPTINYNKVSSIFYLDLGANWNVSDKTQIYAKIDNATNIRPPDIGSASNNQIIYDVLGRSYRIGVRFNN